MPKLHFLDTGLACWLLGIRTVEQLRSHPLRGALFESWVVAEAYKALLNRGEPHRLCFYRSRDGAEADLLIDHPSGLKLLEAKAGARPPTCSTAPAASSASWASRQRASWRWCTAAGRRRRAPLAGSFLGPSSIWRSSCGANADYANVVKALRSSSVASVSRWQ